MTLQHSILFPTGFPLLARYVFTEPGAYSVTAPTTPYGATWVRAACGGAGGFQDSANGWGGGAAYAFSAETCTPGEVLSCQVGDAQHARPSADDVAGDSWVKRPDTSLLVYAQRGRPNGTAGLASASTGQVTRSGSASTSSQGGASAGDDADPYPLGFGGRGATTTLSAWYGGGGGYSNATGSGQPLFPANDGRVVVEFYLVTPGY